MVAFLFAISIVIVDQLTKSIILNNFQPGESLPIIKDLFHITFVCNKGVAFGIFSQADNSAFILFSYACLIIIVFIFAFCRQRHRQTSSSQLLLTLILAGATGNLIDRLRFGCVIDFLDFRIWPVFNIADTAITIGAGLLILQALKTRAKKKNASHTI